MPVQTQDFDPEMLDGGDRVIIDGHVVVVDDVRCNAMGTWIYYNNFTSSRHIAYGNKIAKVC